MEAFSATLANDLSLLRGLRESLASWLENAGASVEALSSIVLATHEATANAIQYGDTDGPVTVTATPDPDGGFLVAVRNDGNWKKPELGSSGRGLPMMRELMSDVGIQPGTVVRLRKSL